MNMKEAIKNFNKQFEYEPSVVNADKLERKDKFIVAGMGGSHLAAGLLKIWKPELDLTIHRDYGLPAVSAKELSENLIILSSYSGNTEEVTDAEETIDVRENIIKKDLTSAVVSTGGELIELAKEDATPYIQIPDTDIQPRNALGYSLKALLKVIGDEDTLEELSNLSQTLDPTEYEEKGKELAEKLKSKVPVIYSSTRNQPIAYNWKIKLNETGKVPAFYNVLPEMNHNELEGYSVEELSKNFHFIILKDEDDDERVGKRMEVLEKMYKDKGLSVDAIEIEGKDKYHKVFASLILADWTAYYIAEIYGQNPENVSTIEEFKKLIK